MTTIKDLMPCDCIDIITVVLLLIYAAMMYRKVAKDEEDQE